MRIETKRDIIATWFVADEPDEASSFPQSGHNSASKSFQAIYWRCVACFYATAARQAPGAKHVFYTNCAALPDVDGFNLQGFFDDLGVEVRVLPIKHRLGRSRVGTWNNQFYILDIIGDLAKRDDYDTVIVLDSDCAWVASPASLLFDMDRRGVLSLSIPYSPTFKNNGASRIDLQTAFTQLTDRPFGSLPHYSGGELFAATRPWVEKVWSIAEPMWDRLLHAAPDEIKVFEEGQFLSIIYELCDIPTGTADPHCRRMWTALRLNNVSAEDVWSSRCLWHLPMEKKVGFVRLFKAVRDRSSWLWTTAPEELFLPTAACMGLTGRGARHRIEHVISRSLFHLERLIPRAPARAPRAEMPSPGVASPQPRA